ncbi:MAG: hypothetical protein E3J21_17515 [Anaerolineales bacterium]|nr:MAG: hypothetical protein E3J21_17515 [Anaerolineales bacterium]
MVKFLHKLDLNLILLFLLTIFAFAPLTYPGFFQSHSGFLPIYNLYDLEIHLGDFSWTPTVGRWYDFLRGEGVLPYYVAELFRWLGASGAEAIRWSYGLSFVLSAWAMYGWAKRLWRGRAALIAAVVYTYLPYHLAVVYVRGGLAEAWAFVGFPLVLWALYNLVRKEAEGNRYRQAATLALLCVALLLTHVGLTLCLVLLAVAWVLVGQPGRASARKARWPLLALAAGLVFGFFALVPTIVKHGFSLVLPVDFYQHFVYPFQLFSAAWGYGASVAGWQDTMPLQLGLVPAGLTIVSAILIARSDADRRLRRTLLFWQLATLVLVALMLSPTALLWRITGLSNLLSYPWQLLSLIGLTTSLLAGSIVALDQRLAAFPLRAGLVALAVLASYGYLSPRFFDFSIDFTPLAEHSHVYDVEPVGLPVAILGDNQIALLDYRIEGPLRHGATVRLNVLWQALRPLDEDYTVFVHAVDGEGAIWGQRDTEPQEGEYPTTEWGLGEILQDRYELQIDVAGPREGYQLVVGMYASETGERLKMPDGTTEVILRERGQEN